MNSIRKISSLAVVGILAFSANVVYAGGANISTVKAEIAVIEDNSTYQRNGDSAVYDMTETYNLSQTSMSGTGVFKSMSETNRVENTNVPGIDSKGYARLQLIEQNNGSIDLKIEKYIAEATQLGTVVSNLEFQGEIAFTQGSYAEYLLGNAVSFEFTKDAQNELKRAQAKSAEETMAYAGNYIADNTGFAHLGTKTTRIRTDRWVFNSAGDSITIDEGTSDIEIVISLQE